MATDGHTVTTLRDVAELVGITPTAASMALSNHSRISEATKIRVRAAASELGYVPSAAARALRNQKAGAVALIVPNTTRHVFGHSYFMHVLTGVSTVANEHENQVIVSTNSNNSASDDFAAYERVMRSKSADGAIVTSAAVSDVHFERLVASGLPVVLLGNFPHLEAVRSIGVDDRAASQLITDHLIETHGRTRLLHVAGPLDHQTAIDRRDGFLASVANHGIETVARVVEGDFNEDSGRDVIRQLLSDGTPFDGVVFANDEMAFGGLTALKSGGVDVPSAVSIVGFDDFGVSRMTTPGISTIHVPAEEMAELATIRLFELIAGNDDGPAHVELAVEFIPRESCGCPAS